MILDGRGAGSTVTLALSAPCGFLSRAGRWVQPGGSATAGRGFTDSASRPRGLRFINLILATTHKGGC